MQNTSSTEELFKIADENGIEILYGFFPACKAICTEGLIAIDYDLSDAEEKVDLAHELGHCLTGSFYLLSSASIERRRAERKADKWAIKKLVPEDELERAMKQFTYFYELADYFGVTEDFIRKAVDYYSQSKWLRNCC